MAPILAAVGAELADPVAADPVATLSATVAAHRSEPRLPDDTTGGLRPDPAAGVFTTVLARDGVPLLADAHLDRLSSSAERLGFPHDRADLAWRLHEAAAGCTRRRIRLMVSGRGVHVSVASVEGELPGPVQLEPMLLPGGLGAHKWADRRVLDRRAPEGAREQLLIDDDGSVLESARGNVFIVADDGVHTPRDDGRILSGVTRAAVRDVLRERGIPIYERDLRLADLADAEEVFVTNAVRGVVPVTSCAAVGSWPTGRTTAWLRSALDATWRAAGSDDTLVVPLRGTATDARVLLLDNYDSFTYNLAHYAEQLGARVTVVRNDARTVDEHAAAFAAGAFTHLVISPGPGRPRDAGVSTALVRRIGNGVPILGICLGHQCITEAYGGRTIRARRPVHGKPALVHHDGEGVFTGIDGPLLAARYHSLVVDRMPEDLQVTAQTADGTVMGVRHRYHRVEGIQVHPESILTPWGHTMIANFLTARSEPLQKTTPDDESGNVVCSCWR